MLAKSIALTELVQRSRIAIGQTKNSFSNPYGLAELVDVYAGGWIKSANQEWSQDVSVDSFQLAMLTQAELATDRFFRQFETLKSGLVNRKDPHWDAVTAYYAAFYATQALLLLSGSGAVRIPSGGQFEGVLSISSSPSTAAVGQVALTFTKVRGGSHRITWNQLVDLLKEILRAEIDARVILVGNQLIHEVEKPNLLSDARNEINYDMRSSPYTAQAWSSLLLDLQSPTDLEDELARNSQNRPERRFEVVLLAAASLSKELRAEFHGRGGKLDRRQKRARKDIVSSHSWLL